MTAPKRASPPAPLTEAYMLIHPNPVKPLTAPHPTSSHTTHFNIF